ncbi:hypothetical protein EZS27_025815 [termite gut metagenome]|uniref:Uncharacterized protein n=1 Tax=termite gut metagenome TaxID=433724 RepID=A0A5J4QUU6_9ZZZZ
MFVGKKHNMSGSTSVVVVDKGGRRFRELKTIGVSSNAKEMAELYQAGKKRIAAHFGAQYMFAISAREHEEKQVTEYLLSNVENILFNVTQQILNQLFRPVGFDSIEDGIFKQLVAAGLCQPQSRMATVDYLKSHFDEDVDLHKIYLYLDKLYATERDKVQQISVAHTRRI